MNTDKLISLMKTGYIVIPKYLLKNCSKLNIDLSNLMVLAYLLNDSNFDASKIGEDLFMDTHQVLSNITDLQEKGLLEIRIEKNKAGLMEERLSLDCFYNKLALILMDDDNVKEDSNANVYSMFEKELGRTLSPMEYEIIGGWLDLKYSEELIICALKEAVFNGANNLRYIDKILFEWHKKGFKKVEDVKKEREKYNKKKETKIEVPDYNWLDENEEDK